MRRVLIVAASLLGFAAPGWSQRPADESLPKFQEYVYVEELPEAVTKVEPRYPDIAREAGVEGTVMIQVLVNRDGGVADTRVVKSVPTLDQAAIECVRQWRFKPASSGGKPVAVWVAVPIKFTLHGFGEEQQVSPRAPATPEPRPQPDAGAQLSAGRYFINGDFTRLVVVTEFDGHCVRLENPGEWRGAGVVSGSTYWGVFVYRGDASEPKNRGARGTHLGTLEPSGRWRIRGTFTNRPWPEFESTWTPGDPAPGASLPGGRQGSVQAPVPSRDVRPSTTLEHPLWPPEKGRRPGPDNEHTVWPPEWSQGDRRIMLANGARVDVMPEVIRRVEPRVGFEGEGIAGGDTLVVVRVRVERDGSVSDVSIARSVPELDDEVLRAVRQWRFRPARRAGHVVSVPVYVPVGFVGR